MADSNTDKAVLESIFNPYMPLGTATVDDVKQDLSDEENDGTIDVEKAKELEVKGVEKAESGDFDAAMECFNKAIETAPKRSSGYNNRAQLWRLKGILNQTFEFE